MYRDVLIIAYYFPPMGLSGVQRTLKFVKYLPDHGWRPVVLTVSPGGYYAYDESLLKEAETAGAVILRTGSMDPTRFYKKGKQVKMPREFVRKLMNRVSQSIFIPDNKIGWKKPALRMIDGQKKNFEIELVFSTAPPFTDHLIGREISRSLSVPLVLDYRDAWLDYQFAFYPTPFHKYMHQRLEKTCVRAANRIVVVNRQIKINMLQRYSLLRYNDIEIITQGYDPDDFPHTDKNSSGGYNTKEAATNSRPMRITHTGTFIEDITPVPFLRAVAKLIETDQRMKERIKLTFAGVFRKEHTSLVKRLGLNDVVELLGYIDHKECTKIMTESDVLFITLGKKKDHSHHTTGKLYDYFGSRRPILAAVPPGIVAQTVEETKSGIVTDPENIDEIAAAIRTYLDRFSEGELKPVPASTVEAYNRKKLTEKLANIFKKVTEENIQ